MIESPFIAMMLGAAIGAAVMHLLRLACRDTLYVDISQGRLGRWRWFTPEMQGPVEGYDTAGDCMKAARSNLREYRLVMSRHPYKTPNSDK